MKIYKILIICMLMLCAVIVIITTQIDMYNIKCLSKFPYEKKWISQDHTYSIYIPKDWQILNMESIIAQDIISGTLISTKRMDESKIESKFDISKCQMDIMTDNYSPSSESNNFTFLDASNIIIGNYQSSYAVSSMIDMSGKSINFAMFTINTPRGTFLIQFLMIPQDYFARLQPVIERIAGSFSLL